MDSLAHWCPAGWLASPDETDCLSFRPVRGSFQAARDQCRQAGGHVVQPKTAVTTQLVANLLWNDMRG